MIVYQKNRLRIAEYWNDEEPKFAGVDLVRWFQQTFPREGMVCRDFYTILLDLTRAPGQLLDQMDRDTRYEIRRADSKDQLTYDCRNGHDTKYFDQFCNYYDEFAAGKSQPKINRPWLGLLAAGGALALSQALDASGETLVWHVYHRSPGRATLFYSASHFRNLDNGARRAAVGRANRWQHWQDMQRFKAEGISTYDFGGWYHGDSDPDRLRINKFKEEFGGEIVKNYICERALTVKAKVFLRARRLMLGDAI
jgi:hypothetical protein